MKKIFYCFLLGGLVSSCVSQKKFDEISRQLDDCNQKNELTNKNLSDAQQKIADLDRNTAALQLVFAKTLIWIRWTSFQKYSINLVYMKQPTSTQ